MEGWHLLLSVLWSVTSTISSLHDGIHPFQPWAKLNENFSHCFSETGSQKMLSVAAGLATQLVPELLCVCLLHAEITGGLPHPHGPWDLSSAPHTEWEPSSQPVFNQCFPFSMLCLCLYIKTTPPYKWKTIFSSCSFSSDSHIYMFDSCWLHLSIECVFCPLSSPVVPTSIPQIVCLSLLIPNASLILVLGPWMCLASLWFFSSEKQGWFWWFPSNA